VMSQVVAYFRPEGALGLVEGHLHAR